MASGNPDGPADLEEAWRLEIERRIAEVEQGEVELESWSQLKAELQEALTKSKARRPKPPG